MPPPAMTRQPGKFGLNQLRSLLFKGPKGGDDILSKGRNFGTAASGTAGCGFNHRLPENSIDLINQQPCPPIRHFHLAGGSRD